MCRDCARAHDLSRYAGLIFVGCGHRRRSRRNNDRKRPLRNGGLRHRRRLDRRARGATFPAALQTRRRAHVHGIAGHIACRSANRALISDGAVGLVAPRALRGSPRARRWHHPLRPMADGPWDLRSRGDVSTAAASRRRLARTGRIERTRRRAGLFRACIVSARGRTLRALRWGSHSRACCPT